VKGKKKKVLGGAWKKREKRGGWFNGRNCTSGCRQKREGKKVYQKKVGRRPRCVVLRSRLRYGNLGKGGVRGGEKGEGQGEQGGVWR